MRKCLEGVPGVVNVERILPGDSFTSQVKGDQSGYVNRVAEEPGYQITLQFGCVYVPDSVLVEALRDREASDADAGELPE
jgi:hypothetical protein